MIIVNLKGGLGNQMFQYALGRKLAILNKDILKLDISTLENAEKIGNAERSLSLIDFNIDTEIATHEEAQKLHYPYGIISKLSEKVAHKLLRKHNIGWQPSILKKTGNIYLDGYWQSPNYFADIRKTLLKEFVLNKPLPKYGQHILENISNTESVSIHVRRGDYVKNPRVLKEFGTCSPDYYRKAMSEIDKRVNKAVYFVFSDNIKWVRKNIDLPEDKLIFVSNSELTNTEELYLMSKCKHNIIANSSFSWWAAWLNQNFDKLVIVPTPWFDNANYDPSLITDSWIQLPK